jgi:hypothetical protein
MDLWVVKYASRPSRIGDFSGHSLVRGGRIRAFWPLGRVPAKVGCRLGEGNRLGGGRGLGSGHWESIK